MTVVVSDTSVLCYLSLIGRLGLLEALFTQVLLPELHFMSAFIRALPPY